VHHPATPIDFTILRRVGQQIPRIIQPISAPDSEQPADAIGAVEDQDGFNWGYDPYHYGTPEGSYSTDPNGIARIREFREMVQSLHLIGLRVVMDVVYNHTAAASQDRFSVLDRAVPGYYYRLDQNGDFYTNTCCPDTASEHQMFFKLQTGEDVKQRVKFYNVGPQQFSWRCGKGGLRAVGRGSARAVARDDPKGKTVPASHRRGTSKHRERRARHKTYRAYRTHWTYGTRSRVKCGIYPPL